MRQFPLINQCAHIDWWMCFAERLLVGKCGNLATVIKIIKRLQLVPKYCILATILSSIFYFVIEKLASYMHLSFFPIISGEKLLVNYTYTGNFGNLSTVFQLISCIRFWSLRKVLNLFVKQFWQLHLVIVPLSTTFLGSLNPFYLR